MKKNISKLFLLSIAFLFVACDKGEVYYQEWEGEYVAKQTMEVFYDDGTKETHYDYYVKELPLFIFQDKRLYIQTYGIGEPYIPEVDSEEHILRLKSPKHTNMMKDSIENVETNSQPYIVVQNGGVYTYYNGAVFSPKPVLVSKASSDKLTFTNSSSFEVIQTDASGNQIDTFICHWEYSPVQKQNEVYTWDAELHTKSKNRPGQLLTPVLFRHQFVLTRK